MKILRYLMTPIIIFVICQIFFLTNFWEGLQDKASDFFFRLRGAQEISGDIVIVAIDDESFNSLDVRWPFPRDYYAHLIDNLEKAGVEKIVFDVLFTDSSDNSADSILAETAKKYDNIVFAGKIVDVQTASYSKQEMLKPIKQIENANIPWGIVNVPQDKDGFVRSYSLKYNLLNNRFFSIGFWGAKYKGINYDEWGNNFSENNRFFRLSDTFIPRNSYGRVALNFFGPARTFPMYSFANVLDDSTFTLPDFDVDSFDEFLKDGVFKNKIILIGSTVDELRDNFYTPFFEGKEMMPGVEIHANFIEMVKQQHFLTEFPFIYWLIFSLLSMILFYILFNLIKPVYALYLGLALSVASLYTGFFFFTHKALLIPVLQIPLLIAVLYIFSLVSHYVKTAKERKFIKSAFSHYLAPELVNELLKNPDKLEYGGKEQELTVLFSDIRDFTTYTEKHQPKETVAILKEFYTAMVDIVKNNNGIVDKFVGDELMTLFGVPVYYEDHAFHACKTALEMRARLQELCEKWKEENKDPIEIGIGLNSGTAVVGNLGSEQIFDYSAIGDTINLGARLESINKNYNTETKIIISEYTYEQAKERIIVNYIDSVVVKGKTYAVKIYELVGIK